MVGPKPWSWASVAAGRASRQLNFAHHTLGARLFRHHGAEPLSRPSCPAAAGVSVGEGCLSAHYPQDGRYGPGGVVQLFRDYARVVIGRNCARNGGELLRKRGKYGRAIVERLVCRRRPSVGYRC